MLDYKLFWNLLLLFMYILYIDVFVHRLFCLSTTIAIKNSCIYLFTTCFLLSTVFRKVLFLRLVAVEETLRNAFTTRISVIT